MKYALSCVHQAQRICSDLKCENPRDYDYVLGVNTLTTFFLIKIGKLDEALDFVVIAEKILRKVISVQLEEP